MTSSGRSYSSLEYKPSLNTIRFPRSEFDKLLQLAASASD
jgi:hypothetical protein